MLNLVASLPNAINGLQSINVAKAWQKLVEMRNNPTIWNNLAAGAKQDWRNLVTAIGNRMGITTNTPFGNFTRQPFTIPKGTPPSGGGGGGIASSTDVITMADMAKIFPEATAAANSITNATSIIRVAPGLAKTDAATLAATQTTISSSTLKELIPNTLKYDTQLTTSITTAEINFFAVPKTTLAATSTPGQTFGYVKSWEVMFGTEKVYFVTFTAQNANQLNNMNLPITALLTAVNAQGQPVNIATGAVVATSTTGSSSCQVCPITPPRTTPRVLTLANCQALQQLRTSTNNQLGINALCNKITSQLTLKEVTDQLNTYQTSLTANTIANDFLNDIKPTTLPNRHISSNLNSNFGLEQLKAWKKLHTSGFETDFEYIRTLSFNQDVDSVAVNVAQYDVTVLGTKNVVISEGASGQGGRIWATFNQNRIIATGGIGRSSSQAQRNQVLNVPELIKGAIYEVSNYVTYTVDQYGRVAQIDCTNLHCLPPPDTNYPRDGSLQRIGGRPIARDGRGNQGNNITSDNGGHMIGARFDGPVELINYHAQQERSNSGGDWKLMENEWARIINCRNNPNVTAQTITDVKIMVTFPSTTTKRPNGFIVDFKYNGTAQIQRPIPNP